MSNEQTAEQRVGILAPSLAADIINSVSSLKNVTQGDLEAAISEVTCETQTLGSPILQLTLLDPAWKIQRSGLCDVDDEGLVPRVDVNYPPATDVWWRLAMIDGGNDLTQANLTLTFQIRFVSYLQACFGPFSAPKGTRTRAQFIKDLVDRMPREIDQSILGPGPSDIQFVCPQLNVIQPLAGTTGQAQQIIGPNNVGTAGNAVGVSSQQSLSAIKTKLNKLPGIGNQASNLLTSDQVIFVNELSAQTFLDPGVIGAWCLAEESGSAATSRQAQHNNNWLNIGYFSSGPGQIAFNSAFQSPITAADQTARFLKGTWGGASQSIRDILKTVTQSPAAQISAIASSNWAGSHYNNGATLRSTYQELTGKQPSGSATGIPGTTLSSLSVQPVSDVAQLARGTTDNPFEDSWTCMQRLASEVNWDLFGSPQPHPGHWGNYLYYIAATDLVGQKPSLYVKLSSDGTEWTATTDGKDGNTPTASDGAVTNLTYTFDNTSFLYTQNKDTGAAIKPKGSGKGRTSRKTRIRTPQTPSQLRFNMIASPLEFNAGDVFVMQNAGAINGRWIVEDVTHNTIQDLFAQFTCGPPTEPYPEPQAGSVTLTSGNQVSLTSLLKSVSGSSGASLTGTAGTSVTATGQLAGVAQAALICLHRQKTKGGFNYPSAVGAPFRPINYHIFGPYPVNIDCSGFAIACYKAAGLGDPSGNNYNGQGFTGDMIPHCRKISQGDAQPGDLCFFGPSESATTHVNVYVGNGQSVSMGAEGDPSEGPSAQMGPAGFLGFYRSDVVALSNPSSLPTLKKTPAFFKPKLH